MRFTIIAASLLATFVSASPVLDEKAAELFKRESYDCNGSGMCGSAVNFVRDCNTAVNDMLVRNDVKNYGAPGYVMISHPVQACHNITTET